ncbi:hypothetical protein NC651_040084 [Populus alba x Populus x berolinensis]|nr:hypothetical protein NC651_040084 [Populus alba x Populus x berolinensis]
MRVLAFQRSTCCEGIFAYMEKLKQIQTKFSPSVFTLKTIAQVFPVE